MNTGNDSTKKLPPISLLDLVNYLVRYSSEDRKLSVNEIAVGLTYISEYCDEESLDYDEMNEARYGKVDEILMGQVKYDVFQSNASVKKQVRRLLDKYINRHILFGTYIRASSYTSDSNKQVYYAETIFNEMQINILRNSLSVYSYAETGETAEMITKLNGLTNLYNREEYNPQLVSAVKYPGTYYRNLSEITKALSSVKAMPKNSVLTKEQQKMHFEEYDRIYSKNINKLSFRYCAYNENKQLTVRPAKDGEIRIVNPVKLMWVNGFYYLVTYCPNENDKPSYINYRVDRMIDVKCLGEEAVLPDKFSPDEYKYENPVMYTRREKCREIVIRCKTAVINNAIDTFGFNIDIEKTEKENGVIIKLSDVSPDGVKMWALEYGYGAEVISPESLREDIAEAVKKLSEMYMGK